MDDKIYKKLKNLEIPVSESEWNSILNDPTMKAKFGSGAPRFKTSHKILAAVAVLCVITAIPFIVMRSAQKDNQPLTETAPVHSDSSSVKNTTEQHTATSTTTATSIPNGHNATEKPDIPKDSYFDDRFTKDEPLSVLNTTTEPSSPTTLTPETDNHTATSSITAPKTKTSNSVPASATTLPSAKSVQAEKPAKIEIQPDNEFRSDARFTEEDPETSENKFFIPSAFTPNGDGLNDIFYIKANFEPRDFEMNVYSRNGDMLFRSRNIETGWDGVFHGKVLPQGVYMYIIRYKNSEGKEQREQGQILLIP